MAADILCREIILRDEFNSIAVKHIKTVMCTEKNFLNAYLNLDDIQSSHGISARLKRRRSSSRAKTALSQLAEAELVAARVEAAKRRGECCHLPIPFVLTHTTQQCSVELPRTYEKPKKGMNVML